MMINIRQIWTKRMLAAAVALTLSAAAGGVSMAEAAETAVGEAAVTPTATDAVSTAVLAEAAADAVVPPEIIAPVAAPIQEVTGIAKTYGDGAFVDWAVVRYAATINPTSLAISPSRGRRLMTCALARRLRYQKRAASAVMSF